MMTIDNTHYLHHVPTLKESILRYESLCAQSLAQSTEGKQAYEEMRELFRDSGIEYNTLNLAKNGSSKAMVYIRRGDVPGWGVDDQDGELCTFQPGVIHRSEIALELDPLYCAVEVYEAFLYGDLYVAKKYANDPDSSRNRWEAAALKVGAFKLATTSA